MSNSMPCCGFPTQRQWQRTNRGDGDAYRKAHRANHDTIQDPEPAGLKLSRDAFERDTTLRLARLEAAVVSLGVDLPVLGPVDAVVRQTAAGRMEGS